MTYLIVYLTLGVLTLAGIAIDARIRNRRSKSDFSQISDLVRRAHQPWPEAILERLVVPVIAGVAIVAVWPIAIAFAIYFYRRKNNEEAAVTSLEPDHFTVKTSDLMERMTIQEVEKTEIVSDPLQAVPPVPFGHLNRAWLDFKRQIQADDEIWSFQARWGNYRSPTAVRSGYASLRQGAVVTVFVAKSSPCAAGSS